MFRKYFISERWVTASISPGYLKQLLPNEAPTDGEKMQSILNDFEEKIMPGVLTFRILN